MIPLPIKLVLFICFIISDIFYILLLYTIYKHRALPPFNSSFFTFAFNIGILDLIHINDKWLLANFPMFGWFLMDKFVMMQPVIIGTIMDFIGWFTAFGQISAVVLLAANRVSVIGFDWIWSRKMVQMSVILLWTISFVICLPQLFIGHRSYKNNTKVDGVVYYWLDKKVLITYFTGCIYWCIGSASVSAVFYMITLYRIKKQKAIAAASGSPDVDNTPEIKLAATGIVLFILTIVYAIYCFTYSTFAGNPDLLPYIYTFQIIFDNIFSWNNPYMLMMCSPAARDNFWNTVGWKNNRVDDVMETWHSPIDINPANKTQAAKREAQPDEIVVEEV